MKKVLAITAVLALLTSVASAELLKNFKYDGSLEVHSVSVNNGTNYNSDAEDAYAQTLTRLMIGMNFDLTDDVNAQVTAIKNDRMHGTGAQTMNGVQNLITFQEAYLNLKNVFGINSQKIGRQFYGNPGDLVIYYGPLGWPYNLALTVNALDAWSAVYSKDKLTVTALCGKQKETGDTGTPSAKRDINVNGLTVGYDFSTYLNPTVYFYQKNDRDTVPVGAGVGVSNKVNVMGIKANGKYQGIGYGFEYAQNSGKNYSTSIDYKGYAMILNANYNDLDAGFGKFSFMGEYYLASGDDDATDSDNNVFTAINTDLRPGVIFGGLGINGAPATGIGNLTVGILGVNFTPEAMDKLNLALNYFTYAPVEDKVNGTSIGYDAIGNEMDFMATWNHSENVSVKGYYAMFSPDSKFATNAGATKDDATTMLGLNFNVKF